VKLPAYRRLASVQDILLVASDRVAIEHYVRRGDRWELVDAGADDMIRLTGLDIVLPVGDLYADLGLPAEAPLAS
jgi:Uma2 family endonuclease